MIPDNLTPDINYVSELKLQIKVLKMSLVRLVHEEEISEGMVPKKVEQLSKVVKELRREVKEKHAEEKTRKKKNKKYVGKEEENEEGKEEK